MYDVNKLMCDVQQYMILNNMTNYQFAEKAKVNLSTLSRIRSGDYNPGKVIISKIVNTMDKDIKDYIKESRFVEVCEFTKNMLSHDKSLITASAELLTVDELTILIELLDNIKKNKIKEKIASLETEIQMYNQLLSEES